MSKKHLLIVLIAIIAVVAISGCIDSHPKEIENFKNKDMSFDYLGEWKEQESPSSNSNSPNSSNSPKSSISMIKSNTSIFMVQVQDNITESLTSQTMLAFTQGLGQNITKIEQVSIDNASGFKVSISGSYP
ncbi:MAG: hypothetical protein ACRC1M_07365, partial [Methanobacteriaceae archaeon]